MKYYLSFLITLTITSCSSQKKLIDKDNIDNAIVYIIPYNVEQLLLKQINTTNKEIYFYIEKDTNQTYSIYASEVHKNWSNNIWIRNTTRMLFLNGSFYPLIFDLDETFATTNSAKEIIKAYSLEKFPLFNRHYTLFEGIIIHFKRDGTILSSGRSK